MQPIPVDAPSEDFIPCLAAAAKHLDRTAGDGALAWLKADALPPFLEHLSFRLGNRLFFVRVEDVEGRVSGPGNRRGVEGAAEGAGGIACLMPMRRTAGEWEPLAPGWGLVDADTGRTLDPAALVTDEKIEMTDWELHDFAVQVVRDHVGRQLGHRLTSWTGDPRVEPSIWFAGQTGPEWVVVRAVRYPAARARRPANMSTIASRCAGLGEAGHFASVAVASGEETFDARPGARAAPLWRGHQLLARFEGLEPARLA